MVAVVDKGTESCFVLDFTWRSHDAGGDNGRQRVGLSK